jgi:hypothetical protein
MSRLTSVLQRLDQTLQVQILQDLGQMTPLMTLVGVNRNTPKGYDKMDVVYRERLGKFDDIDTGAYPATGGYKPATPTTGPALTVEKRGRAFSTRVDWADEYHHGQFQRISQDGARAAAEDLDRVCVETIEAALTTPVTYATDAGAKTSNLFATTANPWFSRNGVELSNIVAAALSVASLDTALVRMDSWVNFYDGSSIDRPQGPKLLLVHPKLRRLAETLTGAPILPLSVVGLTGGSAVTGDVANILARYSIVPVVTAALSDPDAAYLIDPAGAPIDYSIATPLNVVANEVAIPQAIDLSMTWECMASIRPFSGDIIRIKA